MQLRLARKEDLLGIIECLEVLSDVSFDNWKDLERAFDFREETGNVFTFVVAENDFIMGTASLIIETKLSHGGKNSALLTDVAVRQTCQGLGIGKWLVSSCIDYARNVNCYKIILDCSANNVEFYRNLGFIETGEVEMRINF